LDEQEWAEVAAIADRHGQTVSAWVRQALRAARRHESTRSNVARLQAVRLAVRHDFPTADMDQMLAEIEAGYGSETP
jgi:transposase-like protein